ncbi:MAG TPA: SDR family oxidoreductase [Urbifossiella sp.]|jgi:short-subunit dehydrogenase|nr:SDR family oxidoreductase [Urbifossiella sp.]
MNRSGNGKRRPEVVVITGASAGVGRAVVWEFAKDRAHVGLIARGPDGLEGAKREVEECGGQALVLPLDVADAGAVDRAAEAVEREFGPIDVWVNDAMVSVFSPVKRMTAEDYRRVTEVTYLGVVHGTLAALRHMLPRDRGAIVQVGSALAYRGIPLQSAYCGAKHAIQGFTEALRSELIHDKSRVTVTMVQLPAVNTPQFDWSKSRMPRKAQPVPPIYQPEVPARAIHYAAHHYRREWNVGLMTDVVIAGNAVAPGLGYYLAKTGYDSQMTDEPEDPNRPNDLYDPLPGDRGAHGRFDARAHPTSQQWWVTKNRGWLAAAGLGLAGLAVLARTGNRRG